MMGTIPAGFIITGFQDHSLAVISTKLLYKLTLFKYLISHVNVNWCNYNSYVGIYITWLRQSYHIFIAQLKFNVHTYHFMYSIEIQFQWIMSLCISLQHKLLMMYNVLKGYRIACLQDICYNWLGKKKHIISYKI